MGTEFQWNTEDESDRWHSQQTPPQEDAVRRRRMVRMLVLILVISTLGFVVYKQIQRRIENSAAAVEEDVRASFAVVDRARRVGDVELLNSVLSGSDPQWTAIQQLLVEDEIWFENFPFGTPIGDATIVTVTLSADFMEAALVVEQPVFVPVGDRDAQLNLRRTEVLRRGEDRWLVSPPSEAYWGEAQSARTDRVTLFFPERDQKMALQWLSELDELLQRSCNDDFLFDCDDEQSLIVTLSDDPVYLHQLSEFKTIWNSGRHVTLPTMSAVGIPSEGREAVVLRQLYSQRVLAAVAADYAEWQCCQQELFFSALFDIQLEQLGVIPFGGPRDAEEAATGLLNMSDPVGNLNAFWAGEESDDSEQLVSLFARYLLTIDSLTPHEWQARLAKAQSIEEWLAVDATVVQSDALTTVGFQRFARAVLGSSGPLNGLEVSSDLLLLCQATAVAPAFQRFDHALGSWSQIESFSESQSLASIGMKPLPGQDGAVVHVSPHDESGTWLTAIYRNGQQVGRFDNSNFPRPLIYSGWHDPSYNQLVAYYRNEDNGAFDFNLLDVDGCEGETCPLSSISGLPVWSPDGESTLVIRGTSLSLGDEIGKSGLRFVSRGFTPFWLDNDLFGFLRVLRYDNLGGVLAPENGIFLRSKGGFESRVVVTADDLLAAWPEPDVPETLFIEFTQTHPHNPEMLILVLGTPAHDRFYVMSLTNLDTRIAQSFPTIALDLKLHYSLEQVPSNFHFSRDPNWFALSAFASGELELGYVFIHDIENNATTIERVQFGADVASSAWVDWSPDGEWLLLTGHKFIQLIHPISGLQTRVFHDFGQCYDGIWTQPVAD